MKVTAYSEQKENTNCQPQLNSVSGLLLAICFDFWKIHIQEIKNCIQLQFLSKWDLRYLKKISYYWVVFKLSFFMYICNFLMMVFPKGEICRKQ
jgi:hypothetical protein